MLLIQLYHNTIMPGRTEEILAYCPFLCLAHFECSLKIKNRLVVKLIYMLILSRIYPHFIMMRLKE